MGSKGSSTRDKDFLQELFVATNHNYLLIFTEKGKCFWMRIFEVPEGSKGAKGRALQNLINIEQDDSIKAFINVKDIKDPEYIEDKYIVMCTKKGVIKKTKLEAYSRPRTNGINAIGIREGDELLEAKLTNGTNEIMLSLKSGKAIRFNEEKVRFMGRTASGVRGITLQNDKDEVVGMIAVENDEANVLVVSSNGYGKRSSVSDYRITNRGGKGVKTINVTDKTGSLISMKNVTDDDDLMIITRKGITIRMHVDVLRVMGRATQGVKLISIRGGDEIAAVAKVYRDRDTEEDEVELDEEGNPIIVENAEGTDVTNEAEGAADDTGSDEE